MIRRIQSSATTLMRYPLLTFISFACLLLPMPVASIEPPPPLHTCSREIFGENARAVTFSGVYETEFEKSSFQVEDANCTVWLSGDLAELFAKVGGYKKGLKLKARLTVEGDLTPPGNYGHFGMYERELVVKKVLRAEILSTAEPG